MTINETVSNLEYQMKVVQNQYQELEIRIEMLEQHVLDEHSSLMADLWGSDSQDCYHGYIPTENCED